MQAPGLLGRGGRHQGLLHFSVKKSVASQRKQLSNHAPDHAYIRHWLVDSHRVVTTKAALQKFSEQSPVQFSQAVGKGKGKNRRGYGNHRGDEHADDHTADDVARLPKKGRWRKMQ